jgi:hypothetical protein
MRIVMCWRPTLLVYLAQAFCHHIGKSRTHPLRSYQSGILCNLFPPIAILPQPPHLRLPLAELGAQFRTLSSMRSNRCYIIRITAIRGRPRTFVEEASKTIILVRQHLDLFIAGLESGKEASPEDRLVNQAACE